MAAMLCYALLVLLLRHGLAMTDKERAEKTMKDSIAAASIVRARGDYNSNLTCKWPDCAPLCEDCNSKGMGSCMIPGVNECPWSAKCTMGTCFCSKGYCARGEQCVFRTCKLGGVPPPYIAGNLVHQFARMGGELPPFNAQPEDWFSYLDSCKTIPLVVLALGVFLGVITCSCICCQLECEFSFIPTTPVVLLVLCVLTVGVIVLGVVTRGVVVTENMDLMEHQFRRVDQSLDEAVGLAKELNDMTGTFKSVVADLPSSCNTMVPGAKEAMGMAAEKANEKLLEMEDKVVAFSKVADTAKMVMGKMLMSFNTIKLVIILGPMVPLILMGLWTLTIAVATVISWQSSNPLVAERADDCVIRFGAPGACCAMLVASLLSSSYLFVGIIMGGICKDLDSNVINLVTVVNFTEVSHFKFNIDPILEGAAKYYVMGGQENPLISMIEDVERDATALYSVYTNATWAVQPAEMVCSGVKNLNASEALVACHKSVDFAKQLMSAKNMYPYYYTFGRELMCDKMLHGMQLLIIYTVVVSTVLMPLVALCADVDLRKWERYKMDNYEHHYDMSYEMQEKSPFLGKSLSVLTPQAAQQSRQMQMSLSH